MGVQSGVVNGNTTFPVPSIVLKRKMGFKAARTHGSRLKLSTSSFGHYSIVFAACFCFGKGPAFSRSAAARRSCSARSCPNVVRGLNAHS